MKIIDSMIIREFHANDYIQVIELWKSCKLQIKKSDELSELKKLCKLNSDLFLIATIENQVIGSILGSWDGRRGWINHLAVISEYQHQGIAKTLIKELESRLIRKGCLKINLTILHGNSQVINFYKGLNYEVEEVIFMSKLL